ncbi:MAG TPA: protein kinase [Blastocatellia bacterium]|nr:protein kinase [Blastocatellia bacterium]
MANEGSVISEKVSHYRIIKMIGAGGMGEVYLAEDMRLGRQVALKFLPASYQYDSERRTRLLQEARAASVLRSPNIAAIYDIGEHDGAMFIAMEYVDGEVLSYRIDRRTLPTDDAIDIAMQTADALEEAHKAGIIHRDVKSSNLIITERGMVKMLDFGLAKVIQENISIDSADPTVAIGGKTAVGVVLGTVSYMSPEQALGHDLDTRSDLFSYGVVLYEMLTGKLPFEGTNPTEIVDSIIHKEPVAIARYNYDVPPELERIVRKCLEKDRDRRYQNAREVWTDLHNLRRDAEAGAVRVTQAPVRTSPPTRRTRLRKAVDSLAILPLINEGGDPDTEYLSDGITESIINHLSQLPKLRVMARNTVFRYKGRDVNPQRVGEELGVRATLTGRVLQRADVLIIKVELVDSADGSHLWGEQYNRQLSDIFSIEEEISKEISDKLRLKLSGAEKKRLTKRYTENTRAYQNYLKGRFYWNKRTSEGLTKGIEHFKQAIELDPGYALAFAGLADSYNILASYSALAPREAFPLAKNAASRALELDDKLAEAHTSLAFAKFGYDWDWAGAEREFKQAIHLNPRYSYVYSFYSVLLAALGRFDEALAHANYAQEVDPLSLPINTNVGWILYLTRRYDEAIRQYEKTIDLDDGFALAHRRLAQTYQQIQRYNRADAEYRKAAALSPDDLELLTARGHFYATVGDVKRVNEILKQLELFAKTRYVPSYLVARIYLGLLEIDRVFELLEKALDERYGYLAYLYVEPMFDLVRDDPRFVDLAHRVGIR